MLSLSVCDNLFARSVQILLLPVEEQLLLGELLLGQALSFAIEHMEARLQALIVQLGHLLTRILLHLDLIFKLGCVEQK